MKLLQKPLRRLHNSLKATRQEIENLEKQNTEAPTKHSRKRDAVTASFGLLILLLAITGIVFGSLYFQNLKVEKKQAEYDELCAYYTGFIAPAVLFDTGEFVHLDQANNLSLLIPAFFKAQEIAYQNGEEWETVTHSNTSAKYILPADAVEKAANTLFGRNVICQTFTLDGLVFEYVENERYFRSPITVQIAMYTPNITAITPTDTGVELTVEYVEAASRHIKKVGKTMKFTLEGQYQQEVITAITSVNSANAS